MNDDQHAAEREAIAAYRTHHLTETSRLTREVLELRADNVRLRAALEGVVTDYRDTLLTSDVRHLQNILAATPAPVVPPDDQLAKLRAATAQLRNVIGPRASVPIEEAEELATALESAVNCAYWRSSLNAGINHPYNALAAFRSRHPAPKEPLP